MGKKRIAVVALVSTIVLGLVVLLVFQASPDERLLMGYLPHLEQRFGVKVSFKATRASLSGVVIEGMEVSSPTTRSVFFRAQRVSVGLRIGPLLVGKIQLTGIRFDGLQALVGAEAGGADLAQWKDLRTRLGGSTSVSANKAGGTSKDVEVYIESGAVHLSHGGVAVSMADISGHLTRAGACALRVGACELSVLKRRLVEAEHVTMTRPNLALPFEIAVQGLRAEAPADRAQLEALREALSKFWGSIDSEPETPARQPRGGDASELSLFAQDARFELTRGEEGLSPAVRDLTVRARLDKDGWSLSGSGRLDTQDERKLSIEVLKNHGEPLSATLEVVELPLHSIGPLLTDRKEIIWSSARMTGQLSAVLGDAERRASGQVALLGLEVQSESLALDPLREIEFSSSFKARLSATLPLVHLDSLVLEKGQARLEIEGQVRTDRLAFDLNFRVPRTNCRHVYSAVPKEMRQKLGDVVLDGQIEMNAHLSVDREAPESTVFEPAIDNRCSLVQAGMVPPPDYFRGPFAYTAVDEDGNDLRLVTGPGTDRYTPLHRISAFVPEALLTTEDGKFFHHQGVTAPEVRRAIELNLKRDKLAHGASTITMQLAKNLFLGRERTMARKLQEVFFVWYLETYFTKEELLELYLNIVEFGPSLYGITDAALHYFGREPSELNALESVYLVKLLPNPVGRYKAYEAGRVGERTVATLTKVLRTMRDRRRLSEAEYQGALSEALVFHKEGEPLPMPRPEYLRGLSDLVGSPVVEAEQEAGDPAEEL
ncbi:MAG: transglycosylase domain-containing protein [Myxococcota bacterium]|jgi:hypothetical protein|nr:transglycosylase domain-containing protein [Myxococcota bacterium]